MENENTTLQETTQNAERTVTEQTETTNSTENVSAEVKRLLEENKRLKSANDNLSKENAEQKRTIRASKTAEEQRAEEEKERQDKMEAELNELRKSAFVSNTAKRVLAFTGDETAANSIAEALYGAADTDAAIDAFNKVWAAKEKQLRAEFGKIPAPGAGGDDAPTMTKEQLSAMGYKERAEFANKHPELYNKIMS